MLKQGIAVVQNQNIIKNSSIGRSLQRAFKYLVFSLLAVMSLQVMALSESDIKDLQKDIAVLQKDISRFKADFATKKDEDRSLSAVQFLTREERLRDNISTLAEYAKSSKNQEKYPELVAQLKALFIEQSTVIKEEISMLQGFVEAYEEKRATTEDPLTVLTYEQKVNRGNQLMDDHFEALYQNALFMKDFGLESQADLKFLNQQLEEYAQHASAQLELVSTRLDDVADLLSYAPESLQAELQGQADILQHQKSGVADSLSRRVALMDLRGADTASYQHILISSTGEVSGDVFDGDVASDLAERSMLAVTNWFEENGVDLIWKILLFTLIIILFKALAKLVARIVSTALSNANLKMSTLLKEFFISISSKLVMLIGVLIALSQLGIQVTPLLAGLGVAGFVIGFALQDTLSNFASGMMILIYRPFDEGDVIEAAGVSGKVSKLSLVSTTILTFDNQRLVVPNNKIWGDVIRNVTAQFERRVDLVFGIGYGDDIAKAEKVLNELIAQHNKVLTSPAPTVKVHVLNESSVDFVVRPWVKTDDYWDVYWDLTRQVKERFDEEGISIPFPQRDIHVHQA